MLIFNVWLESNEDWGRKQKLVLVTNTTQVSLFSLIKTQLLANSTLNVKFRDSSYYRFEPSFKSYSFSQLPIIVIKTPVTDGEFLVLDHSTNLKDFVVDVLLLIDFTARDKFDTYANAIIRQLESAEATFETSGYYNLECDLVDVSEDDIQDRKVVVGSFEVRFLGTESR